MQRAEILLLLPDGWPRALGRGICMALGVPPVDVTDAQDPWPVLTQRLLQPGCAVLVDLEMLSGQGLTVTRLADQLPAEARSRIVLTRHRQGPVWPSDRTWIRSLGFADLLPDLTGGTVLSDNWQTISLLTDLLSLPATDMPTVTRTLNHWPAAHTHDDHRAVIRALSGLGAEALAQDMTGQVKAPTRQYQLKSYPKSLLGREVIDWLARHHGLSRPQALQAGRALGSLGFLHHVVHEHALEDQGLFYRSDCVSAALSTSPDKILRLLLQPYGVKVTDRLYLGRSYPACWVGSEAVDLLQVRCRISREDAEVQLNRLWRYGLIRHVVDQHPVKDDHLYYRFQG